MQKKIVIGTIVLVLLGIVIFIRMSNKSEDNQTSEVNTSISNPTPSTPADASTSAELKIEDIKVGTGREVKVGDTIKIHYLGTLESGQKFDSSYDRNEPFETQIGVGRVIQGWDQGVIGMKVGGKRKLTIPSDLGYGSRGAGGVIPPNATLIFELELLDVK